MLLSNEIPFDPHAAAEAFSQLPSAPAVFALRGETGEPYLNRTPNLRRRLERLLSPAPTQSRRLQLAGMVRHISWSESASEFSAQLLLYQATSAAFGDRASKRLHLRHPSFLRAGMQNRYPRLYVTTSVSLRAAADLFGPFASRTAAERYAEQVLDQFLLRRCFQDLDPDPEFPGCLYSEMKKCLAPCFKGCTDERYAEEAAAIHAFLRTHGRSLLHSIAAERERASEALDFEAAAKIHERYSKVEAVAALAPEISGALASQFGVMVQASSTPDDVDLYLLSRGVFTGPVKFSTLGIRLANENSTSTSLFLQPAAFAAVPLDATQAASISETPDQRLDQVLTALEQAASATRPDKRTLCDHQALLARWYFRPERQRQGELVLAKEDGSGVDAIPRKALMRAISRVFRAHVEQHAPTQT